MSITPVTEAVRSGTGPTKSAYQGDAVTVCDLLERAGRTHPCRPAIDFLGRRITYGELARRVDHVAAGLQAIGVAQGDRVGLCLPNTPFFVIGYFAILKIGAVVVNYNPLYVESELEHQIRDSGTSVMFVIDVVDIHRKVAAVAERAGLRRVVVCPLADALPPIKAALYRVVKRRQSLTRVPNDGLHFKFSALLASREPPRSVTISASDLAVLQYTGGTTGTPKGAMLSHRNVVSNCAQVVTHDPTRREGAERVLGVLPFFHVFAMTVAMNFAVQIAAEMVLLPRFDLRTTMKTLLRTKPTVFPAVPAIYGAIAGLADRQRHDLSFVQLCISGGAPLSDEVGQRFRRLTGAHLVEGYGLTEASPVVSCNPADGSGKGGSVGLPLTDTSIEIRDPVTRARVGAGEKGEIVIAGPQVMLGYWNKPDDTAAVLDEHGLRTADIGYLDEDGYLFIVDRIKDLIISGGYNVYPRMIEDALYRHPDVLEAAVIGIDDAYRGQSAKAFVVLRGGSAQTADGLIDFLRDHLSKVELPKTIEIRTSLPRTAVGKLSKKELVAEETSRETGQA